MTFNENKKTDDNGSGVPYSIEAEQALLGVLLVNNAKYDSIDFLRPDHFAVQQHAGLFQEIVKTIEKGSVADPITLEPYAEAKLKDHNGKQYLKELTDLASFSTDIIDYANIIYDLFLRRKLITIGQDLVAHASKYSHEYNAEYCIENAEQAMFAITEHRDDSVLHFDYALKSAIDRIELAYKRDGSIAGISTGFYDLDKILGGMYNSDLIILASRPSMGKTALAVNIAFNIISHVDQDNPVLFFSLEMSAEQIAMRILSQECKISSDKMRRGEVKGKDFELFMELSHKLGNMPFFIDDTPALSVSNLRARARRAKKKHNIKMVIVDYLQLLHPSIGYRPENRVQEISEITRTLKAIAKELDIPVLVLSQLSRAVEQRENKRPQLADLRESGTIEQDADVVTFIYRPEYYEERNQPTEGTEKHKKWLEDMEKVHKMAELIIAKHRNGPVGTIRLMYDSEYTRFRNYTNDI